VRRPSTVAAPQNGRLSSKAQDALNSTTALASTLLPTHVLDFPQSLIEYDLTGEQNGVPKNYSIVLEKGAQRKR